MIGIVYYTDDRKVFRKVFLSPGETADVFNDPKWTTDGCDPSRVAVLEKVSDDVALTGIP